MPNEPSYRAQLGAVLRQRDVRALRVFLLRAAQRYGDVKQVDDVESKSDDELEELMHRMIVARNDLTDLHRASREWLFRHGIDTFGDDDGRRN
jgi:hypothetical protein